MEKVKTLAFKVMQFVCDEGYRFSFLGNHFGFYRDMSDEEYLKRTFQFRMGYPLNLENPTTFNEKLQWLKLHDRHPEYTIMVDKYAVKDYVAQKIGEQYVIPTLGVWEHFDEIEFGKLPEQFVLKTTHDSGGIVICSDKAKFDKKAAKKKLGEHLRRNHYWHAREWPYKDVRPRIIAELFIHDSTAQTKSLIVYKFFCFGGIPKIIQVIQNDKFPDESIDYFNVDWHLLNLRQNYPNSPVHLTRPKSFEKMLELCGILSKGHAFLRVDFYEMNKMPLFSEITFYSDAGFAKFDPPEWDRKLGDWIHLPGDAIATNKALKFRRG